MAKEFHRCWCEIRLDHLKHNLNQIRKHIGPKPKIMGVVKANAYGHGIIPIARFLEKNGCEALACAHLLEAQMLRAAGMKAPLLLLSGFLKEELEEILKLSASICVSSMEELLLAQKICSRLKQKIGVHLKINTGMNRLGTTPKEAIQLLRQTQKSQWLKLEAIMTHFASADSDLAFTKKQWNLFQTFLPKDVPFHACNSPAIWKVPTAHGNWVRPGLALYGISPVPESKKSLKPILTWKTYVTFVKTVPKRTPISYGSTFITQKKTRVATLAVGYGDGYPIALSNRAYVLIDDKKCPILGRVTMDQIMVDVSHVPSAAKGTEVILLGQQGKSAIFAEDLAKLAGTISYEIVTRISERVIREYVE